MSHGRSSRRGRLAGSEPRSSDLGAAKTVHSSRIGKTSSPTTRGRPYGPGSHSQTSGLHVSANDWLFHRPPEGVVSASLSLWFHVVLEEDIRSGLCGWAFTGHLPLLPRSIMWTFG